MANNLTQLKTDFRTALQANLDATTTTKLINRFVAEYPAEWNAYLEGGGTDTPTNRGVFTVDRIFDIIQSIYRAQNAKENQATLPTPEVIS